MPVILKGKGDKSNFDKRGRSGQMRAMPRTARFAPGGVVFHVINRASACARIFGKDARLRSLRPGDEGNVGKEGYVDEIS